MRKELPAGTRYGRLTVIKYDHSSKKTTFYKCQCDCGNIHIVDRQYLVNGKVKSCGCLRQYTKDTRMEQFLKYYNDGLNDAAIAAQLNVTRSAVCKYRLDLGLLQNHAKRVSPKHVEMWLDMQPYRMVVDSESLYHDTEFLQRLLNKEISDVVVCET